VPNQNLEEISLNKNPKFCAVYSYPTTNSKFPKSRFLSYRTRAITSRSGFEAALVYKPRILSFKKESRNNGRSGA
jgi:hypothetical protein